MPDALIAMPAQGLGRCDNTCRWRAPRVAPTSQCPRRGLDAATHRDSGVDRAPIVEIAMPAQGLDAATRGSAVVVVVVVVVDRNARAGAWTLRRDERVATRVA